MAGFSRVASGDELVPGTDGLGSFVLQQHAEGTSRPRRHLSLVVDYGLEDIIRLQEAVQHQADRRRRGGRIAYDQTVGLVILEGIVHHV